jgi:hypothetical protein
MLTDREYEILELYWEAWMHKDCLGHKKVRFPALMLLSELLAEYLAWENDE